MGRALTVLERVYLAAVMIVGLAWVTNAAQFAGVSLIDAEWIGLMLGFGVAAALLRHPYGRQTGPLEIGLGLVALGSWIWMAMRYDAWIIDIAGYTPEKYLPGIAAIVLLLEAMRKTAGLGIAVLVWLLIVYAFFGYLLPPPFQAEQLSTPALVMYAYADTNGVPGLVLQVIGTLVLAFIVLGKLMEVTGAIKFFTDLAMGLMGHRRGGPAKVAVVASSIFGSINGTVVGNIMSSGIVTIPLMKRSGFRAEQAGAIEAVASNGGQFAPPVMGATAFLIAEFLQVPYAQVVMSALVPAALYYVCLFLQVDAMAVRRGLHGVPKSELPRPRTVLAGGWMFLLPFAVLLYLLFGLGYDPAYSALAAVVSLFVLYVVIRRRLPSREEWSGLVFGAGENMLPLLMIGGGAGVVIAVMNITGLGFSLSIVLTQIGENAGMFVMLLLTGGISILLGMGMPTTAIYVVLSVVLAPSLIEMGVSPMAAHLFIFYFGMLSFLTPPVAVASYVAAGLAKASMWGTASEGLKLGAIAYLLPLLWCFNEGLILEGSLTANVYAVGAATIGAALLARALQTVRFDDWTKFLVGGAYVLAGCIVGGSTLWLGAESLWNLGVAVVGLALFAATHRIRVIPTA